MKVTQYIFLFTGILFLSACSKDEDTPPAQASFEITGSPAYTSATITCTNTSKNAFGVEWYVDDVYVYDGPVLYLAYYALGSHKVELKAKGTESWSSVTHWVNVKPPPTKCRITKVELISFPPFFNGTYDPGSSPGSDPDIFYTIGQSFGGNELYNGLAQKVNDVSDSDLPLIWNHSPAITLNPLTNDYYIMFSDDDGPMNALTIDIFTFKSSKQWKSNTPILESDGLKVKLTVEWE